MAVIQDHAGRVLAGVDNGDGTFGIAASGGSSTATSTNVTNAASSTTALASNASRKGATFYNDDASASVYLKLGATASATSFAIKIAPSGYYELPAGYTGRVDVVATAASGTLRVTELS
jgi:hypothetical protein